MKGFLLPVVIIAVLGGIFGVTRASEAQDLKLSEVKISLNLTQVPLKKALDEIENQTKFTFAFSYNAINPHRPISVRAHDISVERILKDLFKGYRVSWGVSGRVLFLKKWPDLLKYEKKNIESMVKGTVTDAQSGETLPGVNIRVKGTSTGTATDADGQYELSVESLQDTLVFSFVGYQSQQIPIDGRTTINISLETQAISGQELVVVGYGTVQKKNLTGSVSKVNADAISDIQATRVDEALQGRAAGVQVTSLNGAPGAGTSIRIRGGNSISASNEPLYVIDGFLGAGDLSAINPQDIKSVEILKGPSATAIYGTRGSNGVVLITTKEGSAGKIKVTAGYQTGLQQLPREIPLMSGPEKAKMINIADRDKGISETFPGYPNVPNTDWQKAVTHNALLNKLNLSMAGGGENTTYYFSSSYLNQDGIVRNSGFDRLQTRLNLNSDLTDWLTGEVRLNYAHTKQPHLKLSPYQLIKNNMTVMPIYKENGAYAIENPVSGAAKQNSLARVLMSTNFTNRNRFLGNLSLKASLFKGLSVKSMAGAKFNGTKDNTYLPGQLPSRKAQALGGTGGSTFGNKENIISETTINYNKTFGTVHDVNILGGFSYQHSEYENASAYGGGFNNDLIGYHNISGGDPARRSVNSSYREWSLVSFFGRINYTLEDKYLFTFNARRDGSSRLGKNNKWAFFPSGAFAWRLAQEDFMQNVDVFSSLKLRLSYGRTGNQAVSPYATKPTLHQASWYFNGQEQVGYRQGNIANPDLKWETTDGYNIGLDAGFLEGNLNLTTNFYYKDTKDLLLNVQIPHTTGYSSRLQNVGEVGNKGIELSVDATISTGDFAWEPNFNIAANRNNVKDAGSKTGYRQLGDGIRLIEGKPAPVFYGNVYEGTWKNEDNIPEDYMAFDLRPGDPKFKDVNGNGKFDGLGDYTIIGSPEPDFYGGFGNRLSYKNWSLDAYFNFSYGNDILNTMGSRFVFPNFAANQHSRYAGNYWTEDNPDAYYPRPSAYSIVDNNSSATSVAVEDGSYLRLQTLKISYSIPPKLFSGLDGTLYVTGKNLWLWTNYDFGYDPDVNSAGSGSIIRGYENFLSYPQARTYLFGINIKF